MSTINTHCVQCKVQRIKNDSVITRVIWCDISKAIVGKDIQILDEVGSLSEPYKIISVYESPMWKEIFIDDGVIEENW